MAKTTAPLLGFDASGQIAKSMVYAKWRGVRYARRYAIPGNPNSVAQQTTRSTFAVLREMWKLAPADARAPWDLFAKGRPVMGLNLFIGENMRVVRGETDFNNFIGSPGAKGGFAPTSVTAAATAIAGQISVTFVLPTLPAGWVATKVVASAFKNQNPTSDFASVFTSGSVVPPTLVVLLTGLTSAVVYQVSGWVEYQKPNGEAAYSVGVTDQATPL